MANETIPIAEFREYVGGLMAEYEFSQDLIDKWKAVFVSAAEVGGKC